MTIYLICGVLVGLPAALGCYLALAPKERRDAKVSATLLFYAIVLCVIFVVVLPEGKVFDANYRLNMPVALVVGAIVGLLAGAIQRSRRRR